MIKDGHITYPGINAVLQNWQPENKFARELLLASLTTLLVYQVTAIIFDLCLGFKKRGEVKVTDLSTFILAAESSLQAVLGNIGCKYPIARWKFHGFRSECPEGERDGQQFKISVISKLFFLLISAPVLRLVGVLLSVERDSVISFKEARFGGVAFGLNTHQSTDVPPGPVCHPWPTKYGPLETALTVFSLCTDRFMSLYNGSILSFIDPNPTTAILALKADSGHRLFVEITTHSLGRVDLRFADLYGDGHTYTIKSEFTVEQGKKAFEKGLELMLEGCPPGASSEMVFEPPPRSRIDPRDLWNIHAIVKCRVYSHEDIDPILRAMLKPATLVNSDTFELRPPHGIRNGTELVSGDDIAFLLRRRSTLSFLHICIAAASVTLIRIVLKLFTNNDVHLGVEMTLKDKLGIKCCDSMLQCEIEVDYKGQLDSEIETLSGENGKQEKDGG